jgi:hypothetical protein
VTKHDVESINALLDDFQVRVTKIQATKSPWERLKASREFQEGATAAVEKSREAPDVVSDNGGAKAAR